MVPAVVAWSDDLRSVPRFAVFMGLPFRSAALCCLPPSVHLRVLDGSSYGPEQQELALESLLEFTREPALMTDVYINYDCDVQCTNLFETICHSLSTHALPRDGMVSEVVVWYGLLLLLPPRAVGVEGSGSSAGTFVMRAKRSAIRPTVVYLAHALRLSRHLFI